MSRNQGLLNEGVIVKEEGQAIDYIWSVTGASTSNFCAVIVVPIVARYSVVKIICTLQIPVYSKVPGVRTENVSEEQVVFCS